jgi:hypothetical protein
MKNFKNLTPSFAIVIDDLCAARAASADADERDRIESTVDRVREIREHAESAGFTGCEAVAWACKRFFWCMTEADELLAR